MTAVVPVVDDLPQETGARAVEEVRRQLAESAGSAGAGDGDVLATPPAPAEGQDVDLSLISIPKSEKLPAHMKKFAGKSFKEISELLLHGEQYTTSKANEAATAKREADDLRSRLAAAEQVAKMIQQPPAPADERSPDLRFLESPAEEARRIAREEMATVKQELTGRLDGERAAVVQAESYTNAFEAAKNHLNTLGHNLDHDTWVKRLSYIVPLVQREQEAFPGSNALANPERYVAHYINAYGAEPAQKPTLPHEAGSTVAGKPNGNVVTRDNKTVPTIDREERQKRKALADTFMAGGHMTKEQAEAFIRGEA